MSKAQSLFIEDKLRKSLQKSVKWEGPRLLFDSEYVCQKIRTYIQYLEVERMRKLVIYKIGKSRALFYWKWRKHSEETYARGWMPGKHVK